ncbi:Protein BZZ1 [Schizosaccharomyces pombe]
MSLETYKFSDELHDDFKVVDSWINNGAKWLEDIQLYYKERSSIEKEYAQKLASLSNKYGEKKSRKSSALSVGDTPAMSAGSLECASLTTWSKILDELTRSSKTHQKLSDDYSLDIAEKLKKLESHIEALRKVYDDLYKKFSSEKETLLNSVKRAKVSYHEACDDLESARQKNDKYREQKTQRNLKLSESDMLDKKNKYLLRMLVYNAHKQKFYNETLPTLLNHMQVLNEYRVSNLNEIWCNSFSIEKSLHDTLSQRTVEIQSEIAKNEPVLDSAMFGRHNSKNWALPADLHFEPSPIWHDTDALVVDGSCKNYLRNLLVHSKNDLGKQKDELVSLDSQLEGLRVDDPNSANQSFESKKASINLEGKELMVKARIEDLEVRINKITSVANNLEEGGRFHDFKHVSFKLPTSCSYCREIIWGLSKRGCVCKNCGFKCHARCELLVPANCKNGEPEVADDDAVDTSVTATDDFDASASSSNAYESYRNTYTDDMDSSSIYQTSLSNVKTEETTPAEPASKVDGVVLYDFTGEHEGVITASEGQEFTLLEPDDGSGWVRVKIDGTDGLIPASYVKLNDELNTSVTLDGDSSYVKALYAYTAQSDMELSIQEGDIIQVTNRNAGNGWSEGILNGVTGQFPANYVTDV